MNRRTFLAAAGGVCTLLSGCTAVLGSGGAPADYDVGMRASAFVPRSLEVTAGDTVVWYNGNDRPHTVTAYESSLPEGADFFASGGFESQSAAEDGYMNGLKGAIYPGERFEHTFREPGRYDYYCIPHEAAGMVGTVTVTE